MPGTVPTALYIISSVNPQNNPICRNDYECEGPERLVGMPEKWPEAGLKPHNPLGEGIAEYRPYHFSTNYRYDSISKNWEMHEHRSSLGRLSDRGEDLEGTQEGEEARSPCAAKESGVFRRRARPSTDSYCRMFSHPCCNASHL